MDWNELDAIFLQARNRDLESALFVPLNFNVSHHLPALLLHYVAAVVQVEYEVQQSQIVITCFPRLETSISIELSCLIPEV